MTDYEVAYHKDLIRENFERGTAHKATCIHIAIDCKYKDLAIDLIKQLPKTIDGEKIGETLTTLQAAELWGELTTRKGTIAAFRQHIMNLGYQFPAKDKIVPKNGAKAEYTFKGVCDFAIATLKH